MPSSPPKDAIRKYGLAWDPKLFIHPAQIDLALYANPKLQELAGKHALSAADHLRAAIRGVLPDHVFRFNRWTNDLIDAWCDYDITTIWGSSSSGKSGTIAAILMFDVLAAPGVTKVSLCTSPLKMHDDRCFGSMKKWHSYLPDALRIGRIVKAPAPAWLTLDREGQTAGVVCISTKEGESNEDLKSKIGAHQKRNRLGVDEPQKCSDSIISVKANFGASGEYKEIFFGNPDSWFSPLGKHSIPHSLLDGTATNEEAIEKNEPDRWLTKNRWRGKQGFCLVLDGRKSPGIDDPSQTHLAGREHLEDLITNFGEDSMQLWTYGIGRMPPAGVVDTLISPQDLRSSGALLEPEQLGFPYYDLAGLDPSGGRDGVRLSRLRIGTNPAGYPAVAILNVHQITVKISAGDISGQIAVETAKKLREWQIPVRDFACDATGNQGSQVDRIEQELGQRGAYRVFFSGPASKRVISPSGHTAQDHYADHATELLANVANIARQGRVRGMTDAIAYQLTTRRTIQQGGKLKAEEKRDWRDRNQDRSPDDLDSAVCAIDLAIERKLIRPFIGVTAPQRQGGFAPGDPFAPQRPPAYLDRLRRAAAVAGRR
jgi:hypothetical protein